MLFLASPIEQFEIFFLTTPVLDIFETWGSLPFWFDAEEWTDTEVYP